MCSKFHQGQVRVSPSHPKIGMLSSTTFKIIGIATYHELWMGQSEEHGSLEETAEL